MNVAPRSSWLSSLWRWIAAHPLDALLVAFPLALALWLLDAHDIGIFIASGIAIVPLAGIMGRATESLAATLGPALGGLLNATFGNAAELIIALAAVAKGPQMYPLVKASITGSVIGNVLLVLGASFLLGGLRFKFQHFNRTAASMGATLLTLATAGLMMPTLYYHVFAASLPLRPSQMHTVQLLSDEIAVVLACVYLLSLVFTFVTHRSLIGSPVSPEKSETATHALPDWSRPKAVAVLVAATIGVAVMGELLVHSVDRAAEGLGMSSVFVGVIVVAIVGNAAEHSTAVVMALKNQMDLSVNIAVGSGIQIALFVAPALVFASMLMGHEQPLDLHFTTMEIVAVVIAILVLAQVAQDGESHWFEGVLLLAVYAVLALAFYHLGEIAPPELPQP